MVSQIHLEVSRNLILHAQEQFDLGDSIQASEKGWGAAARAVKAVAERQAWRHGSHRDLFASVDRITTMTGRSEVRDLFSAANSLHQNFYEGWLSDEYILSNINSVKRLLDILDLMAAEDY